MPNSRRLQLLIPYDDVNNEQQLEEALSLTANDLHFATTAIQADLDRFQRQKVADFKQMTLDFAKMHREYCRIVS